MKREDGSFIVLFKNDLRNEVFLVYRSDYPIWNLTGGGVEKGKSPKEAVIRESFEETGFKVKVLCKLGVYKMVNPKTQKVVLTSHLFEGRVISGQFKPEFPGCKGAWFPVGKLPFDITFSTKTRIKTAVNFNGRKFLKKAVYSKTYGNWHLLFRHPVSTIKFFLR